MALVLACAAGTAKGEGNSLPRPPIGECAADIVFFLDTSGSMCLGRLFSEVDDTAANRVLDRGIVDGIRDAIEDLNAPPNRNLKFTVYYSGRDPANGIGPPGLIDLYNLSIDDPNNPNDAYIPNLEVKLIEPAIVNNRPNPPCLDRPGLSSTFGEDWGQALANVALYHPWRFSYDTCDSSYSRLYFPISDEGPRCGDDCLFPSNMNNAQYGDPDWRAVVDASVCALNNGVRAMPILGCCPTAPSLGGDGASIGDASLLGVCNVDTCVDLLASQMALLTTGVADWYHIAQNWDNPDPTQADPDAPSIRNFIKERTEAYLCNRPVQPPCDSIDFNNDGLFPADEDLVDFLAALAGNPCATCNDIDFNNDCLFPSDDDLIAFLRVLAGGPCVE
jgi:hypothetical protein